MSPHQDVFVLCGIDGGSDTLGLATLYVDAATLEPIHLKSQTFVASRMRRDPDEIRVWGDRISRIRALEMAVFAHLQTHGADQVGMEAPFYNPRRPNAFAALVEVICAMRQASFHHRPDRSLILIDPPTVKNAVGAKGNADKDQVKQSLLTHPRLRSVLDGAGEHWDEHSVDAAAVVWSLFLKWSPPYQRLCDPKYRIRPFSCHWSP